MTVAGAKPPCRSFIPPSQETLPLALASNGFCDQLSLVRSAAKPCCRRGGSSLPLYCFAGFGANFRPLFRQYPATSSPSKTTYVNPLYLSSLSHHRRGPPLLEFCCEVPPSEKKSGERSQLWGLPPANQLHRRPYLDVQYGALTCLFRPRPCKKRESQPTPHYGHPRDSNS